ncbi:MAG: Rieske 2Fe-2S domain-containing protein [Pseudomonadota bacterium]
MGTIQICKRAAVEKNAVHGYTVEHADAEIEFIVVDRDGELAVFTNSCPHTGVTLNWLPDRFLDVSGQYLQCSTHYALFEPTTGRCIHGPCSGQYLKRWDWRLEGEWLVVSENPVSI